MRGVLIVILLICAGIAYASPPVAAPCYAIQNVDEISAAALQSEVLDTLFDEWTVISANPESCQRVDQEFPVVNMELRLPNVSKYGIIYEQMVPFAMNGPTVDNELELKIAYSDIIEKITLAENDPYLTKFASIASDDLSGQLIQIPTSTIIFSRNQEYISYDLNSKRIRNLHVETNQMKALAKDFMPAIGTAPELIEFNEKMIVDHIDVRSGRTIELSSADSYSIEYNANSGTVQSFTVDNNQDWTLAPINKIHQAIEEKLSPCVVSKGDAHAYTRFSDTLFGTKNYFVAIDCEGNWRDATVKIYANESIESVSIYMPGRGFETQQSSLVYLGLAAIIALAFTAITVIWLRRAHKN